VIVTRHRKRRSNAGRILIPLLVLAVLAAALTWPPSQRAIANGPLRPVWTVGSNTGSLLVRPLTFAAQQQTIADRNRELRELSARLEQQRKAKADADAKAQQLRQQVTALANQPQETPIPAPRPRATAADGFAAQTAGTTGGGTATAAVTAATADEKRLAATWAAMEPEKAAAIVQRLPDDAATRVLAAMDADSAGAIMNALPANVAARISRAVAQVPSAPGR
jgi:flagellar motility protein MotE (MotC chaperone)